jgi:hypothetical protein
MPHKETYIDGVWHPSVTTIMGAKPMPWLDAWRAKWGILAARKMKIASAIGTEFHRCVESWLDTGSYTTGPATIDGFAMPTTIARVEGMMQSFVKWAMTIEGTVEHMEMQVISKTYTYSGTLDAVGTFKQKQVIYDWKTSSRIYPDMQLQLAAYAQAYNEQYKTKIKDGLIVHVSKDKPHFKVTMKEFKLGKRPFNEFLKLREMFDEMRDESASMIQPQKAV